MIPKGRRKKGTRKKSKGGGVGGRDLHPERNKTQAGSTQETKSWVQGAKRKSVQPPEKGGREKMGGGTGVCPKEKQQRVRNNQEGKLQGHSTP